MNSIFQLQLNEDDPPKQITKPAKPAKKNIAPKEDAKIPYYYTNYVGDRIVKELRSQVMVDNIALEDVGKLMEDHIKHNLTVSMLKELESHIKIEREPNGFTQYGQTMFVGKISVVE